MLQRAHAAAQKEFFIVDCTLRPILPASFQARSEASQRWAAPAVDALPAVAAAAVAPSPSPAEPAAAAAAASSSSSPSLDDHPLALGPGLGSAPLHSPLPSHQHHERKEADEKDNSDQLPLLELHIHPTLAYAYSCQPSSSSSASSSSSSSLPATPPLAQRFDFSNVGVGGLLSGIGGAGAGDDPPLYFVRSPSMAAFSPPSPVATAEALAAHHARLARLPALPLGRCARLARAGEVLEGEWFGGVGANRADRVSRLPVALFQLVMMHVAPTHAVAPLAAVSRAWNRRTNDKLLWRMLRARSYAAPQARMDDKSLLRTRLAQGRALARTLDAIPPVSVLAHEGLQWRRAKHLVTRLNSGAAGMLHATCLLVFLVLFLLKIGDHFPSSALAPSPSDPDNGTSPTPSDHWKWRWVFVPLFLSYLLSSLSLLSFLLLSARPKWWRQLHADQFGACAWLFVDRSRRAMAASALAGIEPPPPIDPMDPTPASAAASSKPTNERAAKQQQRSLRGGGGDQDDFVGGQRRWDGRVSGWTVLRVGLGLVWPIQVASVLAVAKLDWGAECRCEDRRVLWVHVVALLLVPVAYALLMVLRAQKRRWDEEVREPNSAGLVAGMGTGFDARYHQYYVRCCCRHFSTGRRRRYSLPDRALVAWSFELLGFMASAVLLACSEDAARDSLLNRSEGAPTFWHDVGGWGWWVLAPMWVAHVAAYLYMLLSLGLADPGRGGQVRGLRASLLRLVEILSLAVGIALWNAVVRAPVIVTEVLVALNLSAEWAGARGGHMLGQTQTLPPSSFPLYNSSSNSSSNSTIAGALAALANYTSSGASGALSPAEEAALAFSYIPRINYTWLALPLALCFGAIILCVYCPVSLGEELKHRQDRWKMMRLHA